VNKGLNGHIAMLSTQIICGLNVPVGKSLLAEWMTPIGLASSRVLFATLIFWTIGLVFRREKVNAKDLMVIALGGISGVACTYLSFAWGLNYTTPVHFALIVALNPIVVMLFSVLFLKEAINRRKLTGVLLGIAGAWVLISQMDIAASVENHILGIVFAIVNTVMLGFYLIIIRRVAIKYSPVTLQKWMFLFAALSMLPFSINELYVQPLSVRVLLATITPACIRIVAGNCSQQSAISRRSQGDTAHHCQHLHQPTAYYSFCRCHFNRAGHF